MNILMVLPHSGKDAFFPIGMAYIAAFLKHNGYSVFCLDLSFCEGSPHEALKEIICRHNIKIVCTGGISIKYMKLKSIVESVRTIDPGIIIVVGGGVVSSEPELIAENMGIDIGVIGEGEYTAAELIDAIIHKKDFSNIKGIVYKNEAGRIIQTQARPEIYDIDSLPYPDYEGFRIDRYLERDISGTELERMVFDDNPRFIDMVSSRSCPFNCTFCFHTSGKIYRQRSLDSFFNELEYVISKYRVNFIGLNDELFSVDSERMINFAERIKKYNVKWSAQIKVNPPVTVETLKILKDSGMVRIIFGLESMNNEILKSLKKAITAEQSDAALRTAYSARICFGGNFLFGDPEETVMSASDTVNYYARHPEYNTFLGIGGRIITFPGTPIYHKACSDGIIKDKVKFLEDGCPVVNIAKNMTEGDYLYLRCRMHKVRTEPKCLSLGEVLHSERIEERNGKSIYNLQIRCPHCNTVNEYKNCWQPTDEKNKYFSTVCKNIDCRQGYKARCRKAFYKNYSSIIKSYFFDFLKDIYASLYIVKYKSMNRNKLSAQNDGLSKSVAT